MQLELAGRVLLLAIEGSCLVDEVQLHGQAAGHHDEHAADPRGLVGRGVRGVQAADRDVAPRRELH